jgi:hypothetical protein
MSPHDPPTPYKIEAIGQSGGHCDCCGASTSRVWGHVLESETILALYYFTWTVGQVEHGARLDLIIGPWAEGLEAAYRSHILLDHQIVDGAPQFMVRDADGSMGNLAEHALTRASVIGAPLVGFVFALVDAIYLLDQRIEEIRRWVAHSER